MRPYIVAVFALIIASLAPLTAANAQVTVEQVPREVDSSNQAAWWRPIVVRGNISYVAFNAPGSTAGTHEVKVGVKVGAGPWVFGSLKDENGVVWVHADDIGHDQPTMAVDGDGFIHVFADHHGDNWRYFRSGAANDPSTMLRRIGSMPGSVSMTYPIAEEAPNGDIYLMVRNFVSSVGQGELYRWNDATNVWSKIATFAREVGAVVYPDDLRVDSAGDVHLAFEWAYGYPRPLRHYGSYLRYQVSTGQWRTANGAVLTLPVNRATPNLLYQGLTAGELWNDSDSGIGIQAAGLTVDSQNRPSIAYRYRTDGGSNGQDFDVYRIRWNGTAWADRTKIYTANNNVSAAIETTHNGTRARVYWTVAGVGLMAAESPSWTPVAIATGQPGVSRISGVLASSTEDVIYATAPQEIDANRGSLYVVRVGPNLP
ncbi:BNR-4 repeat-containing protein [Brevundimonas bacteroides]|uniref:BNR-4 repeat-containing protein n=1 Tax=Brevundimonas bacteroides TaxID=74311 RepID=UPI00069097B7|nr:BNR-4 repeat-containing protein [Brevundimonas bacteroides]